MLIKNQLPANTTLNTPPALQPAKTAAISTATAGGGGTPPTNQFQVLRGTTTQLLANASFTAGKPPTPPPPSGGKPTAITLNPITALADLLDGGIQDLSESHGAIIDGILDFIDSLPKPQ